MAGGDLPQEGQAAAQMVVINPSLIINQVPVHESMGNAGTEGHAG